MNIQSTLALEPLLPCSAPDSIDDLLCVSHDMSWFAGFVGRIPRGTNILLGGDPGVGKSTLAQQLAISAAIAGERVLIVATEQTRASLVGRMQALAAPLRGASLASLPIDIVDDIGDLALLPQLLARQVFARNGRLVGTSLVVVDSLHGLGNGPNDRRFYGALFDYFRTASAAGVTTLALAHMNKSREVGGPKALEHAIDVSITMRHGVSCRAMYLPKNRNGASRTEPFSVVIDDATTRLEPSPLASTSSARVRTMASEGPVLIEVALSLPKHERGFVKAPGLSPQEAAITVDLMARIHPPAKSIGSLGVTVRAPGGVRFRREYSLPVAVAIAAALARYEVPANVVVLGDVDLRGGVCELGGGALRLLEDGFKSGQLGDRDVIVGARPRDCAGVECAGWSWRDTRTIKEAVEVCRAASDTPIQEE